MPGHSGYEWADFQRTENRTMRSSKSLAWAMSIAIGVCAVAFAAGPQGQEEKPVVHSAPVSSISMSFEPGYITRTFQFAITLKRDGTATYVVHRAKNSGTFRATGLTDEFSKITKALDDCGYWSLAPRYGGADARGPHSTITVNAGGARKAVIDAGKPRPKQPGKEAPTGFKTVERLLASLSDSANWTKVSDKTEFPGSQSSTGE